MNANVCGRPQMFKLIIKTIEMDPPVTIRNYRRKKKRYERDNTIQRAFQDN
jgi:hypothetical protein